MDIITNMTINPLDYINKSQESIDIPLVWMKHKSDIPLGRWYEFDKDEKPIKLNKKSKKTYNVKIIGNIYDSKPT